MNIGTKKGTKKASIDAGFFGLCWPIKANLLCVFICATIAQPETEPTKFFVAYDIRA